MAMSQYINFSTNSSSAAEGKIVFLPAPEKDGSCVTAISLPLEQMQVSDKFYDV
ncbi:hypothetical protein M569_10728 [Genlisea aurea]|uniref:Uncharacterized protein n=1 Tax=Genlisea aurea TaxID=192259 RepID=S8DM40_9LAMI|nr:hypothetical protein M569_10728 [Genlisea aurea]